MPVALAQSVVTGRRAVRAAEDRLRKESNGVTIPSASFALPAIGSESSAVVIFLLSKLRSYSRHSTLLVPWGFREYFFSSCLSQLWPIPRKAFWKPLR